MTTPTSQTYLNARLAALRSKEGFVDYIYIDTAGHPTTGIGTLMSKWSRDERKFTLQDGSPTENQEIFAQTLGSSAAGYKASEARFEAIVLAHPDDYTKMIKAGEFQSYDKFIASSFYKTHLESEFTFAKVNGAPAITGYKPSEGAAMQSLGAGYSVAEATTVFNGVVNRMESALERAATKNQFDTGTLSDDQRIALISRIYQTPSTANKLVEAVKSGSDTQLLQALNTGRNGAFADRTLDEFALFKGEFAPAGDWLFFASPKKSQQKFTQWGFAHFAQRSYANTKGDPGARAP